MTAKADDIELPTIPGPVHGKGNDEFSDQM